MINFRRRNAKTATWTGSTDHLSKEELEQIVVPRQTRAQLKMAVLMSYHRLIEKDSQHVSYCWKSKNAFVLSLWRSFWLRRLFFLVSILIVLIVTVASSLIISFSLYSLWESFGLNCFMGANLSFVISSEDFGYLPGTAQLNQNGRHSRQILQENSTDEKCK